MTASETKASKFVKLLTELIGNADAAQKISESVINSVVVAVTIEAGVSDNKTSYLNGGNVIKIDGCYTKDGGETFDWYCTNYNVQTGNSIANRKKQLPEFLYNKNIRMMF